MTPAPGRPVPAGADPTPSAGPARQEAGARSAVDPSSAGLASGAGGDAAQAAAMDRPPIRGEAVLVEEAALHRNSRRVVGAAAAAGVGIAVVRFPEGTRTAQDAAAAIGCEVAAIVKSLVLVGDGGPVLALVSGANRADYAKVAAALGLDRVERADADAARAATGFPIGGTAPLGHPAPLATLLDLDLLAHDEVWAAAGTPDTVFAITPAALLAATRATPADIAAR